MLLTVALIAASLSFAASVTDGAVNEDGLRLYEVIPWGNAEGTSLHNYGQHDVDLRNYYLDDGEGTVRFTASIIIVPGTSVSILASQPQKWIAEGRTVFVYGENGITRKNFQLNDKGDEVILRSVSGAAVDVFVYGTGYSGEGWTGDAFKDIPNNKIAKRTSIFDTDSAKDWSLITPGQSSFGEDTFAGTAIPFLLPDSKGMPLMDALAGASHEILISIYEFDHPEIASLLIAAIGRSVRVTILIEGSPVGGIAQTELGILSALHRAGADVLLLRNVEGFKRYSYLHNKYAVIDSEKVVVMSENWKVSTFTNNRGWGSVITSDGYAGYMKSVFLEDSDRRYGDVTPFIDLYPGVLPSNVPAYHHVASVNASYDVVVRPMIGPDFAFERLNSMIDDSSFRVYSEQMTVDISWISEGTPLSKMADASDRGVDSRLIIDVTFDDQYDNEMNDGYWVKELMKAKSIMIQTTEDCRIRLMVHNKGVVIDDCVWIGSMNWNSSFQNNREIGVAIYSEEISDLFASYFLSDWGSYDGKTVLNVEVTKTHGGIVLDASGSVVPGGAVFEWDLGYDGTIDRTGMKIIVDLPAGTHECALYVREADGTVHEYRFVVRVDDDGTYPSYIKYIPIVVLCVMILVFSAIRHRNKDDRT